VTDYALLFHVSEPFREVLPITAPADFWLGSIAQSQLGVCEVLDPSRVGWGELGELEGGGMVISCFRSCELSKPRDLK